MAKPLRFSPATFFYALLPPVVFAAGLTLKKRQFFQNFGAILMFAVGDSVVGGGGGVGIFCGGWRCPAGNGSYEREVRTEVQACA